MLQGEDGIRVAQEFCFQAEDYIREAQGSRGLGDIYKRQLLAGPFAGCMLGYFGAEVIKIDTPNGAAPCLLYTSDAADDLLCVDLGASRTSNNLLHLYLSRRLFI